MNKAFLISHFLLAGTPCVPLTWHLLSPFCSFTPAGLLCRVRNLVQAAREDAHGRHRRVQFCNLFAATVMAEPFLDAGHPRVVWCSRRLAVCCVKRHRRTRRIAFLNPHREELFFVALPPFLRFFVQRFSRSSTPFLSHAAGKRRHVQPLVCHVGGCSMPRIVTCAYTRVGPYLRGNNCE